MAYHDLLAELQGYRNELVNAENADNNDRAGAVRDEISRVEGLVRERADELDAQANEHAEAGQDVLAAEATVEARRYREALAGSESEAGSAPKRRGRPAKENTADKAPKETA